MIRQGQVAQNLGCKGLGVVGLLGALMLPMTPTLAQDEPAKKSEIKHRTETSEHREERDEDRREREEARERGEKKRDELREREEASRQAERGAQEARGAMEREHMNAERQRAQAELQAARAEMRAMAAQLEHAHRRLAELERQQQGKDPVGLPKKPPMAQDDRPGHPPHVAPAPKAKPMMPGMPPPVRSKGPAKHDGQVELLPPGAPGMPHAETIPGKPMPPSMRKADRDRPAEQRLAELEDRLELALQELQRLRREMKESGQDRSR